MWALGRRFQQLRHWLNCTQDPVPEAVGGDMQQLNQLSAQVGPAAAARGRGGSGGGEEG